MKHVWRSLNILFVLVMLGLGVVGWWVILYPGPY